MKRLKVSFVAIIAIIMAVATSAFTAPGTGAAAKAENTYWFLMDASGHVTTTQVTDPSILCPLPGDGCAREYNQSQTQIVGGVRQVKPGEVDNEIASKAKE
ncbi:MAG: hypothetical protein KGM16_13590 [Bacteroidota bacterium]|nr:hypothetical protein [Bacteroidota bacterium]